MSHVVPLHLLDLHSASKDHVKDLAPSNNYNYLSTQRVSALYPKKATKADEEPKIPHPNLFASLTCTTTPGDSESELESDQDLDLPTVGECAVHLELLEVFHKLRLDIIKSTDLDTTFGVEINNKTVWRRTYDYKKRRYFRKPVQLADSTWQTRRRQKWLYFLDIAAGRFKVWMKKMDAFLLESQSQDKLQIPHLPPLDVLMVWHAFLLNPHDYNRACRRHGLSRLSSLPFPWKDVHAAINSRDWTYTLSKSSAHWTQSQANLELDLLAYLSKTGKAHSSNVLTTTLARYGQQQQQQQQDAASKKVTLLDGQLSQLNGLTDRDAAFLTALPQTEAEQKTNEPLVQNVQRQAAFVDKMHAQLWIRSPAVEGTLRRATDRYEKFLRLFRLYRGKTIVPTLDIDLAWHTHQCSARVYAASMKKRTGVFINHDDKLGKNVLDDGMQRTQELFSMRFGEEYDRCLCWDCETMASVIEEADGDDDDDGGGGGGDDENVNVSSLAERVRKDVEYYRCVEISRRAGNALPIRSAPSHGAS